MLPEALAALFRSLQLPIVQKGLVQVAAATVLAVLVVAISRLRGLALEREFSVALVRGFVQVVAMGSLIGILLTVDYVWSWFILVGMIGGATWISKNRGEGLSNVARISLVAISLGSGLVILTITFAGAIEFRLVEGVRRSNRSPVTGFNAVDVAESDRPC